MTNWDKSYENSILGLQKHLIIHLYYIYHISLVRWELEAPLDGQLCQEHLCHKSLKSVINPLKVTIDNVWVPFLRHGVEQNEPGNTHPARLRCHRQGRDHHRSCCWSLSTASVCVELPAFVLKVTQQSSSSLLPFIHSFSLIHHNTKNGNCHKIWVFFLGLDCRVWGLEQQRL